MKNLTIDLKRVAYLTTTYPVTLDDAKTQLHITYTEDDAELTSMIPRAIKQIEAYCNISIIYQRIQWIADLFSEWKLPYGPVIGIESVQNRDSNAGSGVGGFTTATGNWRIDGDTFSAVGIGPFEFDLTTGSCGPNRFKITYTAGMSEVPDDLKQAILKQVVWLFEHKGDEGLTGLSKEVEEMINPYKVVIWL